MDIESIRIFKITFAVFISLSCWGSVSSATEAHTDRRIAANIAKEKGLLKPKEILEWKIDQKDMPKDWIKLDNKYFSVYYPKCFSLEGQEGEEDPKISPSIAFNRGENCPGYVKDYGDLNWLIIGFSLVDFENVTLENNVLRQSINLNGLQAVYLVGLMDHYDETKKEFQVQARSQVFAKCKKKTFKLGFDLPSGKPSMDLVEKNKYDFPEDFKKIVSTFKCK